LERGTSNTGFTLIELMLSLFITAVLIAVLSVVFNTGIKAYRQGKDLLNITRKAQLVLGQMTREMTGAMIQYAGTTTYISFVGSANSVYFMAPVDNSSPVDLCEIGYIWDNSNPASPKIKRHFVTSNTSSNYEYPSPVNYNTGKKTEFCTNVTGFGLRYSADALNWNSSWSPNYRLPAVVEVSVKIKGDYPKTGTPKQEKTFTTWIYLPNSTNNP